MAPTEVPQAEPTLIGYFPKHVVPRPDWLKVWQVTEICSVSECGSPGPEGWIRHWAHNDLWVFSDEQTAWGVVPGGPSNPDYRLFAYRLFPVQFDGGEQRPFAIPPLSVQPLPGGYRRLGYDVVARSGTTPFECSPLSCNGAAEQVPVNRFCLVDDLAEAFRLAARFSRDEEGYEPGPYHVMEVRRRESGIS
jgi:hypothetical protein